MSRIVRQTIGIRLPIHKEILSIAVTVTPEHVNQRTVEQISAAVAPARAKDHGGSRESHQICPTSVPERIGGKTLRILGDEVVRVGFRWHFGGHVWRDHRHSCCMKSVRVKLQEHICESGEQKTSRIAAQQRVSERIVDQTVDGPAPNSWAVKSGAESQQRTV